MMKANTFGETRIGLMCLAVALPLLLTSCGERQRVKELEVEVQNLKAQLNEKPNQAARKAIRELKKINSVTEMGLNYDDYRKVLLEVKPAVDEALAELPLGKAKESLLVSMNAYADAGRFWGLCIKKHVRDDLYAVFSPDEVNQYSVYKLRFTKGDGDYYWGHPTLITNFWVVAASGISEAEVSLENNHQSSK